MDRKRGKFYEAVVQRTVEYGRHEFELSRFSAGGTVRQHLEALNRALPGTADEQLKNPVSLPSEAQYLWDWYMELSHTGRIYQEGIAFPLTSSEIGAWCRLSGVRLSVWELRVIRLLDAAEVTILNRKGE